MRRNVALALITTIALLACAALVAACGDDNNDNGSSSASDGKLITKNADNASHTVRVGSKNFTEEFILGEIDAQSLEAAGYKVKRDLNYGSEQIAYKALKANKLDGYPEYTSTALTSFFGVKVQDVPSDAKQAVSQAQSDFAKNGLV